MILELVIILFKWFSISFEHNEELIKFGTVYSGETQFEIENNPISSFTPSSFLLMKRVKRKAILEKGQHFHGAEITIYKKYFDEIILKIFQTV